jgi:YVTN family beta-propeller protein
MNCSPGPRRWRWRMAQSNSLKNFRGWNHAKHISLEKPRLAERFCEWAILVVGLGALAWPVEALARTGQLLAYVTNSLGNTVSVIDTGDNTVIATVPVGYYPYGIAVTPDGKYVYVANCGGQSETLSVIDAASNTVVGNPIPVGGCPVGIAVTPDGKYGYVANNLNYVSVIDTGSNTVVGNQIPVGAAPNGIAMRPDGKYVYVANSAGNSVSVIETAHNAAIATIPVQGPHFLSR